MNSHSKIHDKTGSEMNTTNYSNSNRYQNSIENCVGNSYLSDIKKKSNVDSDSDVKLIR